MPQQTNRTIPVKNFTVVQEEFEAKEQITPGMLVRRGTDNTVFPHDDPNGAAEKCFAIEDDLQGKGIDDVYAAGDRVQVRYFRTGDIVLGILADGQTAVIGSFLESAGGGRLQVAGMQGSSEEPQESLQIIGMAEEALDMSGSSGEESSGLAANARIQVRIL